MYFICLLLYCVDVIWGGEFERMPIAQLAEESAAAENTTPLLHHLDGPQ